jgi:cellulose biosynthesis protein BcsQ
MEQTEEVVRHGEKSEKIDDDLATLLSKARLEHGEYRRFKRQRVPVRGPATQEPMPMAIGEVAEAPVEKEQPPAARQSKPSRGPLHTLRATFDWIPEASSPGRPRGIGLFSPISGVGCSTLAANLASVLCHAGEQVLLVESSAKGDIALFFGVHHSRAGMRTFMRTGKHSSLKLLTPAEADERWFKQEVAAAMSECDRAILDLGGLPASILHAAFSLCSVVIVPLMPDVRSLRSLELLPRPAEGISEAGETSPEWFYFLNGYREESRFAQKAREAIGAHFGDRLLSFMVPLADEVNEAAAAGMTLTDYSPQAAVTTVFEEAATWVRAHANAAQVRRTPWSER